MFARQYFSTNYFAEQYFPPVVDIVVIEVVTRPSKSGGPPEKFVNIKHVRLIQEDEEILIILREFVERCLD